MLECSNLDHVLKLEAKKEKYAMPHWRACQLDLEAVETQIDNAFQDLDIDQKVIQINSPTYQSLPQIWSAGRASADTQQLTNYTHQQIILS